MKAEESPITITDKVHPALFKVFADNKFEEASRKRNSYASDVLIDNYELLLVDNDATR